jgi:hypothetical protein
MLRIRRKQKFKECNPYKAERETILLKAERGGGVLSYRLFSICNLLLGWLLLTLSTALFLILEMEKCTRVLFLFKQFSQKVLSIYP